MPDLNRMLSLFILGMWGDFTGPNGPQLDKQKACRDEACKIASEFCGVWVNQAGQDYSGKE